MEKDKKQDENEDNEKETKKKEDKKEPNVRVENKPRKKDYKKKETPKGNLYTGLKMLTKKINNLFLTKRNLKTKADTISMAGELSFL